MKKVIMHKYYDPDRLFGGYGWSIEEVYNDWDHIYSQPYYVEIPDNFNLGETVAGDVAYFKDGCNYRYEVEIGRRDCENSSPYLVGGCPGESIRLNVIGIVPENERQ